MVTIILSLFSFCWASLSNSRSAASGDSCPSTSALGAPALQPWPSAALESRGSIAMGMDRTILESLVSADFFVVPTITFRLLFVFVILSHDRRRPIHLAVTANPTTEWTTRQLPEALPWDRAPHDLLRDRDACYGKEFHEATRWLGIREALTAPRSPWQNPYVERLIGTIRASAWTTSSS